MNPKRKILFLFVAIVLLVTIGYWIIQRRLHNNADRIRVSGNIEVTDAEVSFKIPGRVEKRNVDEGQMVRAGDVIATLDSADLIQQTEVRRAELGAADAALAELEAGSRPQEIAVAAAAADSARAEAARLEIDLRRAEDLFKTNVISIQEFQAAEAAYKVAAARLKEAEEQFKLVKEGPRKEEIDQARARVQQARQSLALPETQLSSATVRSPLTGVVLSKNIEPGEYVVPGTPVVTVADLQDIWLRAYIDETDLGRVKLSQPVRVTTDTYPDKVYDGRISFIASESEFTPKSVQTQRERVKLVYRVKIQIANPLMELKPGMPADAEILLHQEMRDGHDQN